MNNAEKFQEVFGYYATEMWAKPEKEFLDWINAEHSERTGEWIEHIGGISHELYYFCDQCYGEVDTNDYDFCPNCGADMRGGTENE